MAITPPKRAVLITGHLGTVGPLLVEKFLSEGFFVLGVDAHILPYNTITDRYISVLEQRYKNYLSLTKAAQDLTFEDIYCMMSTLGCDKIQYIIHAASPASPIYYKRIPQFCFDSNVTATQNLLELSWYLKSRFVFCSTSEVYGSLDKAYFKESDKGLVNSYGERSCYDVSKMAGETLCRIAERDSGQNTGVVRIFNTYSEFGHPADGRVINSFVDCALHNRPMIIFGSGNQTRSFMYASDLVEGIYRYTISDNIFSPVNLGNPNEYYSIKQLAQIICKLISIDDTDTIYEESLANIQYTDLPDLDDPPVRRPDISLAKELLQWEPKVNIVDGLSKVIRMYKI